MNNSNLPVNYGSKHFYSLTCVGAGMKGNFGKMYASRELAEKNMYKLFKKFDIQLVKEYEDNHDKTYICTRNVSFYIQRYC